MGLKVEGWARKAAIPLNSISAVGWVVYVVGYSLYYNSYTIRSFDLTIFTPYWLFIASGLPLYILSITYLLTGNSIVGVATNFFTILSIASGSGILYRSGYIVTAPDPYNATAFAGCLVSTLFLGITLLLSPFFIINTPKCCMNLTEEDRVAFGGQRSQQFQPVSYTSQLTDASYPESHPGPASHLLLHPVPEVVAIDQ